MRSAWSAWDERCATAAMVTPYAYLGSALRGAERAWFWIRGPTSHRGHWKLCATLEAQSRSRCGE